MCYYKMKYEKRGGCMADSRAIGVFDSGLGGLTVARELIRELPQEDIVLFRGYRKSALRKPKPRDHKKIRRGG